MRVTDTFRISTLREQMGQVSERLDRARLEVSSGVRLHRPSDDPAAVVYATSLRSGLAQVSQYQDAVQVADRWLKAEDTTLGDVQGALRAVRTAGLEGANPLDSGRRAALAAQIRSSLGTLVQSANASDGTRAIFAGYQRTDKPFTADAAGVTYHGDTGDRALAIADGLTLTVGHSGDEVFNMEVAGSRPDATLPSVFETVGALADAVEAGDQAAVQTRLKELDTQMSRVDRIRVQTGVRAQQVELATDRLKSAEDLLNNTLTETEGADFAEALVELQTQENVYQALTYVTSRIGQGGLLSWLR